MIAYPKPNRKVKKKGRISKEKDIMNAEPLKIRDFQGDKLCVNCDNTTLSLQKGVVVGDDSHQILSPVVS